MSTRYDLVWKYWLLTVIPLGISLLAWQPAIYLAIGLTVLQAVHFRVRGNGWNDFPVQVRIGYLTLLVLGLWPTMHFWHWIQLAGTLAMLLVDYCPMARFLSLMPWNRNERASLKTIWRTVFSIPVKGSIQNRIE